MVVGHEKDHNKIKKKFHYFYLISLLIYLWILDKLNYFYQLYNSLKQYIGMIVKKIEIIIIAHYYINLF